MSDWPDELLSPAALAATTGYVQRAAQRRWLEERGVPYLLRRDGMPLVRKDALVPATSAASVNWDALAPRRKHASRKAA